MNIGEFFITLGFNADTVKLRDFARTLGDLSLDAAAGIAALGAVEYELVKIAGEAMNAAVAFQIFGSETGLSWQELQKWQIVAQQANVSADAVASSVSALQKQMAEIRMGRGNIAPFQILGISPNQDAFAVLRQLRERIKGLEPATATNLISQMGIDPSMIHLLQMTNTEFEKLGKTVAGMTGEQEGTFLRAKRDMVQFGLVAKYLGFDVVSHLILDLETLVNLLRQIPVNMPVLLGSLALLAAAFFPITAAVVGLVLVLDDLATYFRGGDSVTGSAIEGLKKLGDVMKNNFQNLGALGKIATLGSFMISPTGTVLNAAGKAMATVNQNVTMNIHSTAPAEDVGKAAAKHLTRAASQAALQTNQQGY